MSHFLIDFWAKKVDNVLDPSGTFVNKIDSVYYVPRIDICLEGLYLNSVCLWPKDNRVKEPFLMFERTPQTSPPLSSFVEDETNFDTVH